MSDALGDPWWRVTPEIRAALARQLDVLDTARLPPGVFPSDIGSQAARYVLRGSVPLEDAVEAAVAWAGNLAEQRARRLAHDTGADR